MQQQIFIVINISIIYYETGVKIETFEFYPQSQVILSTLDRSNYVTVTISKYQKYIFWDNFAKVIVTVGEAAF